MQKALDERGIDYEVVKGPVRPDKRAGVQRLSGQRLYPAIEFENGSIYREESKDMAATIRAGKLYEKRVAANKSAGRVPRSTGPLTPGKSAGCGSL